MAKLPFELKGKTVFVAGLLCDMIEFLGLNQSPGCVEAVFPKDRFS